MQLEMGELVALENVRQGLAHFDGYGNVEDSEALYAAPGSGNSLYELAHDTGQVTVADLRTLVQALTRVREQG